MTLVEKLKSRARSNPQRIVLPEGEDPRVVAASAAVTREGFAKVTLLGRKQIIESVAADLRVPLTGIAITEPAANPRLEAYAQIYYERRRARGASLDRSRARRKARLQFFRSGHPAACRIELGRCWSDSLCRLRSRPRPERGGACGNRTRHGGKCARIARCRTARSDAIVFNQRLGQPCKRGKNPRGIAHPEGARARACRRR